MFVLLLFLKCESVKSLFFLNVDCRKCQSQGVHTSPKYTHSTPQRMIKDKDEGTCLASCKCDM